jgi:AcrR family transcriptional regulator
MDMESTQPAKPRVRSSGPTRKRAPGRPARTEAGPPAEQRDLLLDAAIACFVRKGIAATSLREIAAEAHVTPALLHYYFGDKAQLQDALVADRLLPVLAEMRGAIGNAGEDVAALIAAFVTGIGRVAMQHPWLPPLWVREVLCEGGALRDVLFERIGPQIPQVMAKRFAEAQARGEINEDLDPRLLMVSLVGLTLFPIAGAPIWRRLFAGEPGTAALDMDTFRKHTLALLDRGIDLKEPSP